GDGALQLEIVQAEAAAVRRHLANAFKRGRRERAEAALGARVPRLRVADARRAVRAARVAGGADVLDNFLARAITGRRSLRGARFTSSPAQDGDTATVLDSALDRNRDALEAMLARGVVVHYFDHHYAGDVPANPLLTAHLDSTGLTCTSALVNRYLRGRFAVW